LEVMSYKLVFFKVQLLIPKFSERISLMGLALTKTKNDNHEK